MTTKVLVFESDSTFAQSLSLGLESYGCETTIVDDGEEGIAKASAQMPDLILLSIELPRMNGFSICNKLKRNPELKGVPLVLLSSEATEETFDQHKRLKTRADEYVHKPVTVDELVMKLAGIVALTRTDGASTSDEISLDDDIEIEQIDEATAVDTETDEAFGNLLAPEVVVPAVLDRPQSETVDLEDLELEADDGLEIAPASLAASSEAAAPAAAPLQSNVAVSAALNEENARLTREAAVMNAELATARSATRSEADAKAQVIQKKDAELLLLEKELEALRAKMGSSESSGTAREFLDLREQLNRKDKESLDVRDRLSSKEKEVIRLNDDNIALGRKNADLADQNVTLEGEKKSLTKERDSAVSDKEQAQKRGDDYKHKSDKLHGDLEAKSSELKQAIETHENTLATRDAKEAATRDDHQLALREAAMAAEVTQAAAVAAAILQTQDVALAAQEAALVAAAELARQERELAIRSREGELKAEQDSKLAALHRANEESLRKLRAEHEQIVEEATQAAADRFASRERELALEQESALEEQKRQSDATLKESQAKVAGLAADLSERTEQHAAGLATISQRDTQLVEMEAALAAARAEAADLTKALSEEKSLLSRAREKGVADSANLQAAKVAMENAAQELAAALSRTMP